MILLQRNTKKMLWLASILALSAWPVHSVAYAAEKAQAAVPAAVPATVANPSLTAEIDGVAGAEKRSDALVFKEFALDVKAHGTIADAELTVTIANPSKNELEAQFAFQLPAQAVVTGYAIDLEQNDAQDNTQGLLIDGVLLEEKKAKTAYENQVRGEIDPGLAQVSRAGVFSTSIYPIDNDGGTRRMRLRFSFPIGSDFRWPIQLDQPAGKWSVNLAMEGQKGKPSITLPGGADVRIKGQRVTALSMGKDSRVTGDIHIQAIQSNPVLISRHKSGDEFIHISGDLPKAAKNQEPPLWLRIFWDKSLSRTQGNVEAERKFAVDLTRGINPLNIQLVTFDADSAELAEVESAGTLDTQLSAVRYGGGSSLAALETKPLAPEADICVMFYDGVATVDKDARFDPNCRLHIISSVPSANAALLSHIARQHGGAFHVLTGTNVAEITRSIASQAPVLQSIRGENGRALPFIPLPAVPGKWAAIVKSKRDGTIEARLVSGGKRSRQIITLDAQAQAYDGAGAIWAKSELALRDDGVDRKAFLEFARRYSVEYPGLSFLVLEEPEDYVRNDIAPPKSYPKDMMAKYTEARAELDQEAKVEKEERFSRLVGDWEEMKEWWGADYDLQQRAKNQGRQQNESSATADANEAAADTMPPPPPMRVPVQDNARMEAVEAVSADDLGAQSAIESAPLLMEGSQSDGMQIVIVTGSSSTPKINVAIDAWQPDRPYLKALASAGDTYADVFLAEEKKHGGLPAFYLDVSRWQMQRGETQAANRTLLSALELPVANDETALIVAQRLLRFGQYDRAIDLLENIAARQEFLSQPKRHLALALLKRAQSGKGSDVKGDYERGISMLYDLAVNSVREGDEGIDMIALVEANAALPAARKAGANVKMDERLVALLDTDLRVVVDWTTESTDLDLWVYEPSQDKAFYGNPRTQIGGHMSNDMTDGYGPEEYLLRKAVPGDYNVSVDVYRTDRINPNGTSVLTARLIRNFGRPDESEEYVDIELTAAKPPRDGQEQDEDEDEGNDNNTGERKVGTITVGKSR